MPTASDQQRSRSLLTDLRELLERMENLAGGPDFPLGTAIMTANRFHQLLKSIYGENAHELRVFPLIGKQLSRDDIRHELLARLQSGREILEFFVSLQQHPREAQLNRSIRRQVPTTNSRRVFVVHGHDHGTKEMIGRYLSRLDLEPIILHEQANQGRTVMEKFHAHAAVDYAIVLFTPDDVGYSSGDPASARPRARQNAVLELGFFLGTLGRERVCVLYRGDVEIPSDYSGVLYVELDAPGAWRQTVAREMKAAGIEIDLNRAL